jgi:hypothetical protein
MTAGYGGAPGQSATGLLGPYLRSYQPTGALIPNVDRVSVAYYRSGRYVLWPNGWQPGRPPRWTRPFGVVEVALGQHRTDFPMELPASSGAAFFHARVEVRWCAADPELIADAQLRDVSVVLRPELEHRLLGITLQYPIGQADRATRAITDELARHDRPPLGVDVGLTTQVFVRLDLDDLAIQADNDVRSVVHSAQVEERTEEMKARRLARMEKILARGAYAQAAALAAENPGDLRAAIDMLNSNDHATQDQRIGLLTHMMDLGIIPRRQLNQDAQALLDWLHTRAAPLLPGSDRTYVPPAVVEREPPRQLAPGRSSAAGRTEQVRRPGRGGTGSPRNAPVSWELEEDDESGAGPAPAPAARSGRAATQESAASQVAGDADDGDTTAHLDSAGHRDNAGHRDTAAHRDEHESHGTTEPDDWYRPYHASDPDAWDEPPEPFDPPEPPARRRVAAEPEPGGAHVRDWDDDTGWPAGSWSERDAGNGRAAQQPEEQSRRGRWSDAYSDWGEGS